MSISETDIKLMASERMTDEEDGGGMQTAVEIIDGESNNLFPDISRLDRTYGDVAMRKAFASVQTDTTDVYYGSHLILAKPPADPNVSALLFDTGSHDDERAAARDRIENYVVRGPISAMYLYERQLEGQRAIKCYQRPDRPLPEVGEVYCLVQNEDDPDEYFQYVRITSVNFEDLVFSTGSCGVFIRRVITMNVGSALRHTFDGPPIDCKDDLQPEGIIRETDVADASKYYGAVRLSVNIDIGDLTVDLATIYGQLVPSTRGEAPIIDVQAGGSTSQDFVSGPETFEIAGPANTQGKEITIQNRAYNYVFTCQPIPAPGTLAVDFRALGKWYRLVDNGAGELEGEGTGTVNFQTGSVIVTTGALPDVDSEILLTWATPVHYTDRAGTASVSLPEILHDLGEAVTPASASFTWLEGTVQKTATAAINGDITGDAVGYLAHATGEFWLRFTVLPDANSQLQIDYDADPTVTEILSGINESGGHATFSLGTTPIKQGSLHLEWELRSTIARSNVRPRYSWTYGQGRKKIGSITITSNVLKEYDYEIADNGLGDIGDNGTIVYATGAVDVEIIPGLPANDYNYSDGSWSTSASVATEFLTGIVTAKYIEDTGTPTTKQVIIDIPDPQIEFLPLVSDNLIPGTLRFVIGGTAFSDRSGQGVLYWTDGTVAGTVDYQARTATLEQHNGGGAVSVTSLVSAYGDWYDYEYHFRTPGSPLQPGGFLVNATDLDGDLITESAEASGYITSAQADGFANHEMGVVQIRYGALVLDSGLSAEEKSEDWYDPVDVDGNGYIWKPEYVYPNTVRFNCVVYTHLPLDADILGLDPVRLPSDGQVPIVRPGDVIVIHQDETYTLPDPLAAGQVVQLPHTFIASCGLYDAEGDAVDPLLYTGDRKLGRVTMADPLDLATPVHTEPLEARYRIEAMQLISDVQIGGTLTCVSPFAHAFDKTKAYCSTALIAGDLQARIKNFFHQATWTGVWADARIGDDTIAKYNDTSYPLAIQNDAAIKQRWLIQFTSTTTFTVTGETVGQIATGNTTTDLSPVNILTGLPYFTMFAAGWGAGWSPGNCVRFNTQAAASPVWVARCVVSGEATNEADEFAIQVRGDAD